MHQPSQQARPSIYYNYQVFKPWLPSQNGPQDKKKAFDSYMQAAVQGDALAQYNVGNKYHFGKGVDKDVNQSFIWYKKAADQGDTEAQYNLGKIVYVFIIDVQYVHFYIYNNRISILRG